MRWRTLIKDVVVKWPQRQDVIWVNVFWWLQNISWWSWIDDRWVGGCYTVVLMIISNVKHYSHQQHLESTCQKSNNSDNSFNYSNVASILLAKRQIVEQIFVFFTLLNLPVDEALLAVVVCWRHCQVHMRCCLHVAILLDEHHLWNWSLISLISRYFCLLFMLNYSVYLLVFFFKKQILLVFWNEYIDCHFT